MNPPADRPPNESAETGGPSPLGSVQNNEPESEVLQILEADLPSADAELESLPVLEEARVFDAEPVPEVLALDAGTIPATPTVGRFRLPHAGWALAWSLLLGAGQLVAGLAVGLVLAVTILAGGGGHSPEDFSAKLAERQQLLNGILVPLATFLTLATALGIVVLAFRQETARCMGLRGMTWTQTLLVLLSVLPCALLASEVTNYASEILPSFPLDGFSEFAQESWWLVFVGACLFPGIGEELFFRGFLSRGLIAHHGAWLGTLITAFYFGAIHVHPIQACGAFALGIVLQFVFLTTRSLWGAVLLHTANNAVAFLAMRYGESFPIYGFTTNSRPDPVKDALPIPNYDRLIEAANGTAPIAHTAPLLLVTATAATAALAWGLLKTRTHWLRPDGSEWSRGFVSAEGPSPDVPVQTVTGSLDAVTGLVVALTNVAFFAALIFHVQR